MTGFDRAPSENNEMPEIVQSISEQVFGRDIESVSDFFEWIEEALNSLLAKWGFTEDSNDIPSQLRRGMRIGSEGNYNYIVNVDDDSRVEIDIAYDLDGDGYLSREELESYIQIVRASEADNEGWTDIDRSNPDVSHAELLNRVLEAHMRNLSGVVGGNSALDNASGETVRYSSERPDGTPERIGERVLGSPMYNLKYRQPASNGATILTSGVPGSSNSDEERDRLRSEFANDSRYASWLNLSDAAFDVMYAYEFHGVRSIFSLSYNRTATDAVNELVQGGFLDDGPIRLAGDSINTSSPVLTQGNKRLIAEAVSLCRSAHSLSSILVRCTHGAHRAVFIMLAVFMIENNCSREEAQRRNGVRPTFISMYPEFDSQLSEVPNCRNEILGMI